ncbi:MAG: TetR/AcrR family transcriptional regulator [Gaiellaceae bacterium]
MTATRMTADERREEILDAALHEFAGGGLYGTTTDDIARRAGISQPYLFRLFGTKKELFIATVERCFEDTLSAFRQAAGGAVGEPVLHAMGQAYVEKLADPRMLRCQMHAYAACNDPDVCRVVRLGFGRLVEFAEQASGLDDEHVSRFFGGGMLLNVVASMDLLHADEEWATRLIAGCKENT